MSNFKLTSQDKQKGKIVYNAGIVQNIVELAVAEVEGTIPTDLKKGGVSLYLERDGIYVGVSVGVKYGYNIPELAYRVQQSVKQSVENMTRFKVAEVNVHIQDVVFDDNLLNEKEERSEKEEKDNEQ